MNVHVLEQLVDSTLPGCCPAEPESSWLVDVIGYFEPTGIYAETLEHHRDLAYGVLDPEHGFLSQEANEDESFTYAEALAIATQGGVRTYEQDQGVAPLVAEGAVVSVPNADAWQAARLLYDAEKHGRPRAAAIRKLAYKLARDGDPVAFSSPLPNMVLCPAMADRPNADAFAAAFIDRSSPRTDLDVPELVRSRRHWRDMGPDESNALISGLDAESHGVVDPDALAIQLNSPAAMLAGGIAPSHGLDGVTVEELEELLGEQGAANYLAHLYTMALAQLDVIERRGDRARHVLRAWDEGDDGRPVRRRHIVGDLVTLGRPGEEFTSRLRITERDDESYAEVTHPWRSQNKRRQAALVARGWDGEIRFEPLTALDTDEVVREVVPVRSCRSIDSVGVQRGRPVEVLAFIDRFLADVPDPAPSTRRYERVTCPTHPRWWASHGSRVAAQLDAWGVAGGEQAFTAEWWAAADDAYYVLKFA